MEDKDKDKDKTGSVIAISTPEVEGFKYVVVLRRTYNFELEIAGNSNLNMAAAVKRARKELDRLEEEYANKGCRLGDFFTEEINVGDEETGVDEG